MDEQQRELATNRLLEIIRSSKGQTKSSDKPTGPETPTASAAPTTPPPTQTATGAKKPTPSGALSRILQRETGDKSAAQKPLDKPKEIYTPLKSAADEKQLIKSATVVTPPTTPPSTESSEISVVKTAEAPRPDLKVPEKSASILPPLEDQTLPTVEIPPELLPLPQRLLKSLRAKSKVAPKPVTESPKVEKVKAKRIKTKVLPDSSKSKPVKSRQKTGRKRIIVLDIGTSNIKVLEVAHHRGQLLISAMESRTIPAAMRKSGVGLGVLIVKYIREMLPPSRLRGADVRIVLPDRSTVYRRVNVPAGAAKELVNAIKFQIKKDLPFGLDTCEISYRGWNPKAKDKQELEVLAVDGKSLVERLGWLDETDIIPKVITTAPVASRFLVKDCPRLATAQKAVMLVDIGAAKTTITILDSGKLVLSRTIAAGGDDFTEALSGAPLGPSGAELNDVQAEKYKFDVGLPTERDPVSLKVSILLRPVIERITTEINRSLDFYRREHPEGEVPKLLLFGGSALMKNLPAFLAENIGIEVIVTNPLARLEPDKTSTCDVASLANEVGPIFIPALAVALSDGRDFNVLPAPMRTQLKLREAKAVIAPVALGFTAFLVLLYANELRREASVKRELESIQRQVSDLSTSRNRFFVAQAEFDKLTTEFAERKNDFEAIRIGDPDIPRYLRAISNIVPDNIYLTRLRTTYLSEEVEKEHPEKKDSEVDAESVMRNFIYKFGNPLDESQDTVKAPPVKRPIFGRVIEMERPMYPLGKITDVQLVDFVFALENSGHFRDVAVDSIASLDNGRMHFKIICGI